MIEDKTTLPEGTDRIVTGAGVTAADMAEPTDLLIAPAPPPPQTTADKVREQVKSGSEKLAGQAADKARTLVGQGIERSSEALGNVSRLVADTASGLDERLGNEYGDYARRAAEAIDRAAASLSAKQPDEVIEDARNLVRKSPGVALAGAAVLGFALVRLVRSGLDDAKPEPGRPSGRASGEPSGDLPQPPSA